MFRALAHRQRIRSDECLTLKTSGIESLNSDQISKPPQLIKPNIPFHTRNSTVSLDPNPL